MTDELFPPNECDLPVIPKVSFDFVEDCEVRPAPPPINACPTPELPFAPTLLPDQACADISVHTSISITYCSSEPTATVIVTKEQTTAEDGSVECNYVFDFDFNIPIRCVDISATTSAVFGVAEDAGAVTVVVTKVPQVNCNDPCRYVFDFDFAIPDFTGVAPCATINFNTLDLDEDISLATASLTGTVDRDGSTGACDFDLNLNLKLPNRRLFRGTVVSDTQTCGTCSINIPALSRNVNASVWIRDCCGAETLKSGSHVWAVYDPGYGWGIVSREQIVIVPIKLTSDMVAEEAQAVMFFGASTVGSAFTVSDVMGIYPCAKEDHRGFACCNSNDGSGGWEIIAVEQLALWVEFQTQGAFTGTGAQTVDIVSFNGGSDPGEPPASTVMTVYNPLDFVSSIERKGFAMRDDSCYYQTWQIQCAVPEPE